MKIVKIEMGSLAYAKANKDMISKLRDEGIKVKSLKSIDPEIADFLDENDVLVASFAVNEDGSFEALTIEDE